ncbi:MAG: hypothetical protein KKD28_07180 [Chloroflexi bacterium]|nr:hypothetical protein [Chloroflexota bacterium]MBU1661239.1 hypothetical protein [Chloroflexota bacterium]
MKHTFNFRNFIVIATLILSSLACGLGNSEATPTLESVPVAEAPTALPNPTAAPAVPLGDETRLDDQGFAFRPLPDYQLDTSFGAQLLAPGADPDTGPAFMLVGGTAFDGTTAASLIDSLKSSEVIVSEPQAITLDGREGLVADIQRTTGNLLGRVVAVMVTPQQQFVVFGVAPQAQWEAEIASLFDALLGSVKLFEMESTSAAEPATTVELTEIRQWANSATASSQYGSSNWSALQATGAPNVTACADDGDAWAAAKSTTVEWLEVTFAVPVEPTQVNVHISYNPTYITKMELIDLDGVSHQIYGFEARSYSECPTIFSVDMTENGYQASRLKITIDQSTSPSWVEIDAVELVGMGDASLLGTEPAIEPTQPAAAGFDTPDGFLVATGRRKGFRYPGTIPRFVGHRL